MNKLFAWLSGFRKLLLSTEVGVPEPVELVSYTTHYLAPDGTEQPSLAGAIQRIEVETEPDGIIQTRLFSLEPECLIKTTRAGVDAAGQPHSSRVRYWPWGQEAERISTCVENGQRSVEHQLFFGNGDLSRHKKMVGKRMVHTFVYIPPRFAYGYAEQMPLYPGGNELFLRDVQRKVKYPSKSLRNQEAGKVYVGFAVRPDGWMDDISIVEGVTPALDAAALEAFRDISATRWRPGFQNRQAVAVTFTMPITFSIK